MGSNPLDYIDARGFCPAEQLTYDCLNNETDAPVKWEVQCKSKDLTLVRAVLQEGNKEHVYEFAEGGSGVSYYRQVVLKDHKCFTRAEVHTNAVLIHMDNAQAVFDMLRNECQEK